MATLENRLIALATAVGNETKSIRTAQGTLSGLSTLAKTNLVVAINEIFAMAEAAAGGGVAINDTAGDGATSVTWSANKIHDELTAAIGTLRTELTSGASAALDTFAELAAALGNDPSFATTIATGLGNRVRVDAVQTFSEPQKLQARSNIDAASITSVTAISTALGNPDADLVAAYNAARA